MWVKKAIVLSIFLWTIIAMAKGDATAFAFVNPVLPLPAPVTPALVPNGLSVENLAQSISYDLQHSEVLGPFANFIIYQPYDQFYDVALGLLSRAGIYDTALAKVVAEAVQSVGVIDSKLYFDAIGYTVSKIWFKRSSPEEQAWRAGNYKILSWTFVNAVGVAACAEGLVNAESVHRATTDGEFNTFNVLGWTTYEDIVYWFNLFATEIKRLGGVQ